MKIDKLISHLENLISEGRILSRFNPPADMELVENFEKAYMVRLPASYKSFLEHYNGGYITKLNNRPGRDEEIISWNSNVLMSIEQIIAKYTYWKDFNWKSDSKFKGSYPFIPFCQTLLQEYLVFIDQDKRQEESAVYDAFHEDPADDWGIVSHDFPEFFEKYIERGGIPDVMGRIKGNVRELLPRLDYDKQHEMKPQQLLEHARAYVTFNPGHAFSYNLMGEAHEKMEQYAEALESYSRSIEMDPDFGYYYFCRGSLLMKLEELRKALPDMDAAAILNPGAPFYLAMRGELFFKLGKLKESLDDCNGAIAVDPRCEIAYFTRREIYLLMGETEKAAADEEIIYDLLAE